MPGLDPSIPDPGDRGARCASRYRRGPHSRGYAADAAFFRPLPQPSDAVLDFGGGNGGTAARLRPGVRRTEGLGVAPRAAAIARSTGLHVHPSVEALPETPAFDAVGSSRVLEPVGGPAGTLERLRPALRPVARLLKLPVADWRARDGADGGRAASIRPSEPGPRSSSP